MSYEDSLLTEAAITTALASPQEVTVDGNTVRQHSLKDLINLAKYQNSKNTPSSARRGLRFTQLIPGSTL